MLFCVWTLKNLTETSSTIRTKQLTCCFNPFNFFTSDKIPYTSQPMGQTKPNITIITNHNDCCDTDNNVPSFVQVGPASIARVHFNKWIKLSWKIKERTLKLKSKVTLGT